MGILLPEAYGTEQAGWPLAGSEALIPKALEQDPWPTPSHLRQPGLSDRNQGSGDHKLRVPP